MEIGQFLGFLLATTVGMLMAVATYVIARRTPGLPNAQSGLVGTLTANNAALASRVAILEGDAVGLKVTIAGLEAKVERLEATTIDLANENTRLRGLHAAKP